MTHMSINEWMDKQSVIYTGICTTEQYLAVKRNEVLTHADEPRKHCKWNKPDTKGHILYDPFIWYTQNRQIHIDRKYIEHFQGAVADGEWRMII